MFESSIETIISVLGQPVHYQPVSQSAGFEIRGVFERKHIAVSTGMGIETSLNVPTLFIRIADLGIPPAKGDKVTVDGKTYTVDDVQKDGHGGAELIMRAR